MAEHDKDQGNGTSPPPKRIEFHYVKSNYFRVIHADGAYGGVTSRGLIHLDIFSERSPIPQKTQHEITVNGKLGKEVEKQGKSGVVREVEIGVVMNLDNAKSLVEWLNDKIAILEKHRESKEENS